MPNRWKNCRAALVAVLLFVLLPSISAVAPVSAAAHLTNQQSGSFQSTDVVPGSYIVVLKNSGIGAASAGEFTASVAKNVKVEHTYDSVFHGFSGQMSPAEVEKLSNDPRVASIEPNRKVHLDGGGSYDIGVNRINAELNSYAGINGAPNNVNVDIAIVDTGVGPSPQLNIAGGHDCSASGGTYSDGGGGEAPEFYHGTFVAGLAAGIDNNTSYAGVAPGARIWALRVFDVFGNSDIADVVCALNWVKNHGGIEVVNMSLGMYCPPAYFECSNSVLHTAIQQLVAAKTTVVVAAGNDASNAGNYIPAQYSEVITVSALADSDGEPGGFGTAMDEPGCDLYLHGGGHMQDDSLACWSNYGSVVDIAAPGQDLISLGPYSTYQEGSGTSFSSPLVAGAAALYIVEHPGVTPSSVRSGLLARRERVHMPGDRDTIDEGILNASGRNAAGVTLSRDSAQVDMAVAVNLSGFLSHEIVKIKFDSTVLTTTEVNSSGVGTVSIKVPAAFKGSHPITVSSNNFAAQTSLSVSPRIRITPTSGIPGSGFDVSLRGFAKQQHVTVRWYNGSSYVSLGTVTTSNSGSANVHYYVPTTYRGGHKVEAVPSSGGAVSTAFAVKPRVKLTPSAGASGSNATVEIKGFVKGESVKVYLLNGSTKKLLRTLTASSSGSGSSSVTIPVSATLGSHVISAEGIAGSIATSSYNVTSIGSSAGSPSPTPTATTTPTETASPIPTVSESPTAAPTEEPSAIATETATPEATATGIPTEAPADTPTAEPTQEPTETPTVEPTETPTP